MDAPFRSKVERAIEHAKRVLSTERAGYILQASLVSHVYGDKFCLVEWMTMAALECFKGTLATMGMTSSEWKVRFFFRLFGLQEATRAPTPTPNRLITCCV